MQCLKIYEDQAARQEPFRQLGVAAINPLADLLGLDYQQGQAQARPQPQPQIIQQPEPQQYTGRNAFLGGAFNQLRNNGAFRGNQPAEYRQQAGPVYAQPQVPDMQPIAPQLTQEQRTQNAFNTLKSRPGYQFQFDQGQAALDQSAASRGMLMSGQQVKAATQYGQDYGSNAYDKEINRLSLAMGGGQVATQAINNAAGAYGSQTSANALNLGNARASAYATQGRAAAGMANGIAGAVAGGVGIYSGSQGWT